ncbi:aminotransferase class I/II-fold pyridoxal phosphate-dependent enzyme [Bailinhaonella thermotolerans]|uniref:8-amino-7-oxononanoate synthase n=2 Tax=Bailinhaonella thermotolerans TaxID=1070861 RepID=A0A3A4AUP0_9ACTN|nr:aminotransferase class I/II-fold pyridoxal phosphate-dependent enzyme [Bailinhaonella thermotolerans]
MGSHGLPGGRDAVLYHRAITHLDGPAARYDDGGPRQLMMTTYDYLGLLGHPLLAERAKEAIDRFGTGAHGTCAGASTLGLQRLLERRLAEWAGREDALVFPSGFQANQSAIPAIAGKSDWIFSDEFNHASIVQGCQIARARGAVLRVFRHNDAADLARALREAPAESVKLVVSDSVFSVDGDLLDLPAFARSCREHDAFLYLDEAHGLGVLGPRGRGLHDHFALPSGGADFLMATLSKTLASVGGFVAASAPLIDALRRSARGYVFSGAPPAPVCAAVLAALDVLDAEGAARRDLLRRNVAHLKRCLRSEGVEFPPGCEAAIVPVPVGDERRTLDIAEYCRGRGVMVVPMVWPICPRGQARLRLNVTAHHIEQDISTAVACVAAALRATAR